MSRSLKKLIILIPAIILIAAACNKQVSVQPAQNQTTSTDQTANWKTYTNTDYGYSIKYPSTWTVDLAAKDNSGKTLATFLAPGMNNEPHGKMVDIQVSPTTNVSRVDSADYIKRNGNVIISTSPVVVGGVSTDKFITNLDNGYNMKVYVDKNSETYILELRNTTSSDKEYIDNFDLMLSSFKFTDAVSITNRKTYNDSKYNFEIQYPQNWKLDKYTDGYNNEGPYVLVFTTSRSQMEHFPFISVRENWSVNTEIDKINNSGPGTKVKSTKDIKIGSISARQITYSTDIGLDFQKTIISQAQTVFMFDSYPSDTDLDQILSTFKFTK